VELLRQIATDLEYLGEHLMERMVEETALLPGRGAPSGRVFRYASSRGSWRNTRGWMRELDAGDADRKPVPKPDIRSR
jgi:hypothetical protein